MKTCHLRWSYGPTLFVEVYGEPSAWRPAHPLGGRVWIRTAGVDEITLSGADTLGCRQSRQHSQDAACQTSIYGSHLPPSTILACDSFP